MEVEEFSSLMSIVSDAPLSNSVPDRREWVGDKSGSFSRNSFFELLIDSPDETSFAPHKMIWKVGIPSKVELFSWLAAWKRANTCDLSQRRRPYLLIPPSWCILCKHDNESNDHLLLHCQFAQNLWARVFKEFEVIGALPQSWYDFLSVHWCLNGRRKKAKFLWRCCSAVVWCIWLEHNARIFEDRVLEASEVCARLNFQRVYGHFPQIYLGIWLFLIFIIIGMQLWLSLTSFCFVVFAFCLSLG